VDKSATGSLSVDGRQVAQGKIERTIPLGFSLDETLDVGQDTGTPVVEDYGEDAVQVHWGSQESRDRDWQELSQGQRNPRDRAGQQESRSSAGLSIQQEVPSGCRSS
jgi:hypothetical protein